MLCSPVYGFSCPIGCLEFLQLDTATQTRLSIYKGWAFVAVTALLLAHLLRKELNIRAQDQAALRQSEERLRVLGDNLPDSYVYQYGRDTDGTPRFLYLSAGVERLHGLKVEEVLRDAGLFHRQTDPEQLPALQAAEAASSRDLTDFTMEMRIRHADGQWRWMQVCSRPRRASGGQVVWDGVATDITERKRAEAEREKLQAQLIQAQRMESVGRLAGGVAHDFNNMLGVILGYTELALNKVDASSPLHADLVQVQKAAERSAEITRQLLAFARKQTISPRVLDLNETVEGMLKMLRRLIEENIDLVWQPKGGLWPVKMDPTQIDQILANLCVNARDAIAGAGKLIIETGMVTLDEAYCAEHAGFVPGDYVLLAVSDNGCGMDPETLSHLFEPFFTTKEVGKGTGLGLATVYGIVKQNNGFINAYSEPEKGTTFKIYLPRHAGERESIAAWGTTDIPRGNGEIVLVVEDDAAILELTQTMLTGFGYRVLEAPHSGIGPETGRGTCRRDSSADHRRGDAGDERPGPGQTAASSLSGTQGAVHVRLHGRSDRPSRRPGPRDSLHSEAFFPEGYRLQGAPGVGREISPWDISACCFHDSDAFT